MPIRTIDLVEQLKVRCQSFIDELIDAGSLNATFREGIVIRVYRRDDAPPEEGYEIPYRAVVTDPEDE